MLKAGSFDTIKKDRKLKIAFEFPKESVMPKVSRTVDEQKKQVILACISLFNEKGLKFTMDDVSSKCHISKKTMYILYSDKEALFLAAVDFVFDKIKESEKEVISDESLSTEAKIRKLLGVLPEGYTEMDFSLLWSLKDKYPPIYKEVEKRLETGWEASIELIEKGQLEGVIKKDIHIPLIKLMLEASIEQFFQRDTLVKNRIRYKTALDEIVNIIVDGILE